jgi:3-(3-hydroxy-phenyl)propionate hydroxylase
MYEVIIVGCGPVGATVANLLGQYGHSTLVVEKEIAVHPQPRAIHFDDETMRIFQAIGLQQEIAAATRPILGMHFVDRQGRLLLEVSKNAGDHPLYGFPPANVFYQPTLEAILRSGLARFPRVDLQLGWAVESFGQDKDGASITMRSADGGSSTVHGRFLLGCDGASSVIRRQAEIELRDLGLHQPWLVVDLRQLSPLDEPTFVRQICDPARPATFVPSVADRRRWEFMLLPGESPAEMLRPERVRALLSTHADPDKMEIERAAVYTFHALLADRWRAGRVFLLGDAAHQMPPFLGQGMCAGIRDAHNLAWKLDRVLGGSSSPALLDTYQSERRPHVAQIIRMARLAGGIIQTRRRGSANLRDRLLRTAMAIPPIRRWLHQLETVVPGLRSGCLAPYNNVAGKLLPQPTVEYADGRVDLLDMFLGDGFALIHTGDAPQIESGMQTLRLIGPHDPWPGKENVYRDLNGQLVQWMAAQRADILIVRPDRYLFGGYRRGEYAAGRQEVERRLWE